MPFRATFDCLWCGRRHEARDDDDLAGWAQLCPDCLGKAGDNGFLRTRLRAALRERSAAATPGPATGGAAEPAPAEPAPADPVKAERRAADARRTLVDYYEARAGEYDDSYLRRGRYARGPIHDAAWDAELDAAGRWLDDLPFEGEIVELATGTGWWSPLLASKGELSCYDAASAPLDRARDRLLAHGLRAHLHVRDAWAEPDRVVDGLFTGFFVSHVPRDELDSFLGIARRWLRPGGIFALIDSLPDPQSGAADHPPPRDDRALRRLNDGREFEIVKVLYTPDEIRAGLLRAGFRTAEAATTGRFFLLAHAAV